MISGKIYVAGHRGMVGYQGRIAFDACRPDGAPRKLMGATWLNALSWMFRGGLEQGLQCANQGMCFQGGGLA